MSGFRYRAFSIVKIVFNFHSCLLSEVCFRVIPGRGFADLRNTMLIINTKPSEMKIPAAM